MNIEEVKQLAKQGDREGAIAMLRQMLEQNEGERELVLLELGVVYNAMGETTQAINHLNEVMRINPENTKAKAYLDMINGILDYYCNVTTSVRAVSLLPSESWRRAFVSTSTRCRKNMQVLTEPRLPFPSLRSVWQSLWIRKMWMSSSNMPRRRPWRP